MNNLLKFRSLFRISKQPKHILNHNKLCNYMNQSIKYPFSENKKQNLKQMLDQNKNAVAQSAVVGEDQIDYVHTKGSISILDKVPGVKAQNGQMYVLSFTCNKCGTKNIRSFTKHAYHKGVVLVRCGGCQSIHLVADNIGWFEDKPINVETMNEGKVQKIKDPIAIAKFLNKAFQQDKKLQEQKAEQSSENNVQQKK